MMPGLQNVQKSLRSNLTALIFIYETATGKDVRSIWNLIPPLFGGPLRFSFDAPYPGPTLRL